MDAQGVMLFFIGLFAAFLGTLAGGAGLITLPAMMLFGIPVQVGVATNKFSTGIASFAGVITLTKQKAISWKRAWRSVTVAIIGGVAGASITSHLSERTMNIVALILLCFALVISLGNWEVDPKKAISSGKMNALLPLLIAIYDGSFGPGSSTFGILHYTRQTGAYLQAVQLTRVLIFGSCLGAFLIYYQTGYFQWYYAIPLALGSILGTEVALKVVPRIPKTLAKKMINGIIVLLIVQVSLKLI